MELIPIGADAQPLRSVAPLDDVQRSACESVASMYNRTGHEPPWVGYLAAEAGRWVGTCAFVAPPSDGRVEIAYFAFPGHEGRGVATAMARALLGIVDGHPGVAAIAKTLPEDNASTAVLRKLGFTRAGTAIDHEAGTVWLWERRAA